MATENPNYEQHDRREAVLFVLRNWQSEITAVFREIGAMLFRRRSTGIVLEFRDRDIVVEEYRSDGTLPIGRIDRQDPSSPVLAQELSEMTAAPKGGRSVTLRIAAHNVLRPKVRLPIANARTLRKALQYELDRLSPVDPDALYFDFAIVQRDRASRTAELEVRLVEKSLVDEAVSICHEAGISVCTIRFSEDDRAADWRFFPIDRVAFLRSALRGWSTFILAMLGFALGIALLVSTYVRSTVSLDAVNDALLDDGQLATRIEHLQHEIDGKEEQFLFLAHERQAPLLVGVLAELSRFLPDGTWITNFAMNGQHVRIEGQTQSGSTLTELIDRSSRFRNARFARGTVAPGSGQSRFDLTFDVVAVPP